MKERIKSQLAVLKEVAEEYSGKTIGNIIMQLESRLKELEKQQSRPV